MSFRVEIIDKQTILEDLGIPWKGKRYAMCAQMLYKGKEYEIDTAIDTAEEFCEALQVIGIKLKEMLK